MRRDWEIKFEQTYREGNEVANWLAMAARDSVTGKRVLVEPPERLKPILHKDLGPNGQARWVFPVGWASFRFMLKQKNNNETVKNYYYPQFIAL